MVGFFVSRMYYFKLPSKNTGRQILDSVCSQNVALLFLLSSLLQEPEKPPQEQLETGQYTEQNSKALNSGSISYKSRFYVGFIFVPFSWINPASFATFCLGWFCDCLQPVSHRWYTGHAPGFNVPQNTIQRMKSLYMEKAR